MSGVTVLPVGLTVLIDPDRSSPGRAEELAREAGDCGCTAIWVGGSFFHTATDVSVLRAVLAGAARSSALVPVYSILGLSSAEPLLMEGIAGVLLPLIGTLASVRDLFMQAFRTTPALSRLGVPVIPLAYISVDGGNISSASHGLQGVPIPRNKPEVAATLAKCAVFTGARAVFLDAGSGAHTPIPPELIRLCRDAIDVPLFVGGGIRSPEGVSAALAAGADTVVVGTAFEDPSVAIRHLALACVRAALTGARTIPTLRNDER